MNKKTSNILSVLFLMMIVLTGCSSTSKDYDAALEESVEVQDMEEDSVAEELGVEGETSSRDTNQKLIHRANMYLEVTQELDPLIKSLENFIKDHNGYIENMEQYTRGHDPITQEDLEGVFMYIRIPHKHHDKTIQTIEEFGNVTNKSSSVEDVTLQYSDIESTLKMYKLEQDRLLEMLENETNDIKDIIEIEQRLSEVRVELEKQESARRILKSQIDYDTIELEMVEVRRETGTHNTKSFGNRIKRTFVKSIDKIIVVFQKIVLGFTYMLIPLIIIGVIIGILYVPIKKIRKYIKQKKENREEKDNQ